ncbi:hypothetical protein DTO006G1_3199 [Penicillium roqueforti]|uniref:uncharacterized protein n=1 Tax=Penicillium roqueforti TaxID=5082 RepID=UPI001909C91A|nr:uncharacterized protein LCP9604111_6331 [Penicillium roqueforti]KAF9247632.1 hypothetical protein LCP9604111_6331 [Penicillium roqueforti]KAI1834973.1 hypothetical protein CBS147337_4527 [Penicillium roqueforti]KAI2712401.1 hypothetical protein CBS147318_7834 [Penicillium roqueforti]KAI2725408.1 hypothetical protein CBS147354_4985 [Penicillium roqueforti]KAI2761660.1 hypothetical protein DTO006G1_3199 [Penicillium roqueforti]
MSSPAAPKEKLFTGISATETKLLVLANVCLKNDKIDYEKLALNAGIKASSAQTLFRNAKRKLDKMYGNSNADANANGATADLSPEETPSKRGKSTAKAPRTPKVLLSPKATKTSKTVKSPKATKATKTSKGDKAATKTEESADQVSAKPELSPTTAKSAADVAGGTFHGATVTEPATEPSASAATTEQTEQDEEASDKIDNNDKAARDLVVNQHLPESLLAKEDDTYEEEAQEDEQHQD